MKRSTGFQYIDRDRLLLAIRIAKRDVQCLAFSNGEDNTYIHEPPEKINVNHNSASIDYNSTNVTRNFHETQKPISGKSRISASRNGLQRVVCKPTVHEQYQTMENKMPVRSDSPPIRDTDNWTPNRRRALHEPTERQLRNSQESRIRQLQAKMSQYSAALAEIQEKYLMDKISPRESKSSNELMKKSSLKPTRNRPKSSSVSTSLIRPKFTSLRPRSIHKSNLHYPNKTQKPVSSSSIKQINDNDTMSPITNSMNSENHYNSKIDSLWEQAAKSLNINKSDVVILQPDKSKHLTDQSCEKSLHTSVNGCNSQISSNQLNTDTINSNFDNDNILRRAIEQLLLEIDQAEIEENAIRRRWANKLVYIDDRMHSSNCFHSIAKTDPVCINHNSNLISTSCGEFQSEMKYKPFLCPDPPADPITSPLPQILNYPIYTWSIYRYPRMKYLCYYNK
ncbi:unnamed protein product [Heterobilharzia americana]|nr:unnamed protein product [Heterobilharzia americana]